MIGLVSALVTALLIPLWIRYAEQRGLCGIDRHKPARSVVAERGGVPLLAGLSGGVFLALLLHPSAAAPLLPAWAVVALVFAIGLLDDHTPLRWWVKLLLPMAAAAPLLLEARCTTVELAGLSLTLGAGLTGLIIAAGISGAANACNMVAGYNGLEAGMVTLLMAALLWEIRTPAAAILLAAALGAVLVFLWYNRYPARLFPGDCATLPLGALIAVAVVLGARVEVGLALFALYFLNILLMLFRIVFTDIPAQRFARLRPDGTLQAAHPYNLYYLLIRLLRPSERQLVGVLLFLQLLVCAAVLLLLSGPDLHLRIRACG